MNINRKLRFQLLVQNGFFVVLFLLLVILLGYLASQYRVAKDITQDVSTTYESLSPWKLSVSPSGLVSSLDEGLQSKAGDTSIVITYNTPNSQGWNKVFLKNQ